MNLDLCDVKTIISSMSRDILNAVLNPLLKLVNRHVSTLMIFEPGGSSNSASVKLNKPGRYIYCCVAYDEENGKLKSSDILHPFHRDI